MKYAPALVLIAACGRFGFEDEPPLEPPTHVPGTVTLGGTGALVLGTSLLDTTALTIDGGPPTFGQLVAVPQLGGGPELALLQADHVTITAGTTLTVVGGRGLVILARTVEIAGRIDASGGPGRPGPGAIAGTAEGGQHEPGDVCDSGGGGGGHASAGARGGDVPGCLPQRLGGAAGGDDALTILLGGSSGGAAVSSACGVPGGGGGGGALQLSASEQIMIGAAGEVLAGGGGGTGGPECGDGDAGGGGGGGAGGAIFFEAPNVSVDGLVIANGGGGGAGGNGLTMNGAIGVGGNGATGTTRTAAVGGVPPATNAGNGGTGGTETQAPSDGASANNNAGGGGGSVGRIVIAGVVVELRGVVSPTAH